MRGSGALILAVVAGCSFDGVPPPSAGADAATADAAVTDGAAVQICASAVFDDDFDDGTIGSLWQISGDGDAIDEAAGTLTVAPLELQSEATLRTAMLYDFRDRSAVVEIAGPDPGTGGRIGMSLQRGGEQNFVGFTIEGGELQAFRFVAGNPLVPFQLGSHDPVAHRFLRIRVVGDQRIDWDTSPDGVEWSPFATANYLTSVRNTELRLGAIDFSGSPDTVAVFGRAVLCES